MHVLDKCCKNKLFKRQLTTFLFKSKPHLQQPRGHKPPKNTKTNSKTGKLAPLKKKHVKTHTKDPTLKPVGNSSPVKTQKYECIYHLAQPWYTAEKRKVLIMFSRRWLLLGHCLLKRKELLHWTNLSVMTQQQALVLKQTNKVVTRWWLQIVSTNIELMSNSDSQVLETSIVTVVCKMPKDHCIYTFNNMSSNFEQNFSFAVANI